MATIYIYLGFHTKTLLGVVMPAEVKDLDTLIKLAEGSIECRVYRNDRKGYGKIKVRRRNKLYTYVVSNLDEIDSIVEKLNCDRVLVITPKGVEEKG